MSLTSKMNLSSQSNLAAAAFTGLYKIISVCVTSLKSRGRGSERPGKPRQMGRMTAASLMTWCRRCDRARSSTRTCQRWNATASASTTRARTRAESDRSRSSTSEQSWGHHSWSPSTTHPHHPTNHQFSFWVKLTRTFLCTLLPFPPSSASSLPAHTTFRPFILCGFKPKVVTNDQIRKFHTAG